jgi:hypothetical protein
MNKPLLFCLLLLETGGAVPGVHAGPIENKLQMLVPEGVSLGMTREELQALRPKAKAPAMPVLGVMRAFRKTHGLSQAENVAASTPPAVLYEADLEMPCLNHEYYFIDNKMRAVKGCVSYLSGEKDTESARQVLGRLLARMVRHPDIKIVAADSDFQLQTITFSQWKDKQTGKVLFFFDSPENTFPGGTQAVLFDEKYFEKKDFFLEPEDMPKIAPLYDRLRERRAEHRERTRGNGKETGGDRAPGK